MNVVADDKPGAPRLVARARLKWDAVRSVHAVLLPETVVFLTPTAAMVLALCDGVRSVEDIIAELSRKYPAAPIGRDVPVLLARLSERGILAGVAGAAAGSGAVAASPQSLTDAQVTQTAITPPVALLAELTYRCPLRCGYCSNPTDLGAYRNEIDTATWTRVFGEAAALGVLQLHLSGGEPLLRDDLAALIAAGRGAGLYTNLITSAHGLDEARLDEIQGAGLDHVQISLQDSVAERGDAIAGTTVHDHKLRMARAVKARGMALSINVVIHRGNIERTGEIIALADDLGAERLELANTQYHGWALQNRDALLPSREALQLSAAITESMRGPLRGRMSVLYVLPDYYTDVPKPCMDGWARRFMTVIPDGTAYPCPGAHALPIEFPNVREHSLGAIWRESAGFNAYRGTAWMPEPCSGCERRDIDHGGCRCQAFALTGAAANTDPACARSPLHSVVSGARGSAQREAPQMVYRVRTKRGVV